MPRPRRPHPVELELGAAQERPPDAPTAAARFDLTRVHEDAALVGCPPEVVGPDPADHPIIDRREEDRILGPDAEPLEVRHERRRGQLPAGVVDVPGRVEHVDHRGIVGFVAPRPDRDPRRGDGARGGESGDERRLVRCQHRERGPPQNDVVRSPPRGTVTRSASRCCRESDAGRGQSGTTASRTVRPRTATGRRSCEIRTSNSVYEPNLVTTVR